MATAIASGMTTGGTIQWDMSATSLMAGALCLSVGICQGKQPMHIRFRPCRDNGRHIGIAGVGGTRPPRLGASMLHWLFVGFLIALRLTLFVAVRNGFAAIVVRVAEAGIC